MVRRLITIAFLLVCVVVTSSVWVFLRTGRQGEGDIERWVARQILKEAAEQLNPTLSFGELDYQYPTTVVVRDLKLTADDPRVPSGRVDVIAAGEAVLTLAEPPAVNRPIHVQTISLYKPAVRLVRVQGPTGRAGFAGLSGMLKRSPTTPTQPSTQSAQERLREVLSIQRIELIDGRVEYDPRLEGGSPMVLDQITALLQIEPTRDGVYRIQTNLGRKPIAESSVRGTVDINAMRIAELQVSLTADLDGEKADYLPPELQHLLSKYDARGQLRLTADGELSLADPSQSQLSAVMTLASANLALEKYRFPLQQLDTAIKLGNGQLEIERFQLNALQGEVTLTGSVQFTPERDLRLEAKARGIDLKELIDSDARSDTSLSGTLDGDVRLEVPLRVLRAKMRSMRDLPAGPLADEPWPPRWGLGTISISNGRLMTLPVIRQINSVVSSTLRLGQPQATGNDRLTLEFEMNEQRINLTEVLYVGSTVAGRGKGHVTLDQNIDIWLNGGPVEKMQSLMGRTVGGLFGRVTDSLAGYRVTGRIGSPQVTLQVAPGLFGGRGVIENRQQPSPPAN